jgi:hypothetical protein
MKTYFLLFKVRPLPGCQFDGTAKGAYANIWVLEKSPRGARRRADHHLEHHRWKIEQVVQDAVDTCGSPQTELPTETWHFHQAQKLGISIAWVGWLEDSP